MRMIKNITVLWGCMMLCFSLSAQVKASYIYNTSTPYGVLDLRTRISSSHYYYLREGTTFSYRESTPGVRTNTFRDMTPWDSNPYRQGHLRLKNGTKDSFVMNYRLLMPNNYSTTYAEGYPLIVLMHGAGERANCLYNSCYHSNFSYDPNVNSPAAPKTVDHRLLNNDHNVNIGGKQHLDARNLSGTRLPNDPALPARAFQGFVLIPQMFNVWDSLNVQDVIRLVRLHCQQYKIDQNRIYIHGLSIGGYATYEAIKRAPWLFAAALPMSAVREAGNIFKHNQQNKVVHLPLWVFQGGKDIDPSLSFTNNVVAKFRNAGAVVRYSVYSDLGHNIWNRAYGEAEFFSWMKSKNKSDIHLHRGVSMIIKSRNQYPRLMLAEGFFAYQWERNGVIISGATSNTYTATVPGTYRARFSRVSSVPTASQWNRWSKPVTIGEGSSLTAANSDSVEVMNEITSVQFYPNPVRQGQNITLSLGNIEGGQTPLSIQIFDLIGNEREVVLGNGREPTGDYALLTAHLPVGTYLLIVKTQNGSILRERIIITR